jgi:methylenetetrahydrofolate dehydrogenase (NADP+)/methenyltetrahydrofolate cyclohydrolase
MEILNHYGIDPAVRRTVVIGRSLVVGKPVTMMLIAKNATVTVCHTRTMDMPDLCRKAEILIVSAGRAKMIDKRYLSPNQIVIDVGINVDENGNLCGDVDFVQADPVVGAITPVPGGVGTVTTSVLVKHVVEAAAKSAETGR